MLERLIPLPRRRLTQRVDLGASPARVWQLVRHTDLARTAALRVLLGAWLPTRGRLEAGSHRWLSVEDFHSTPTQPGFQMLASEPLREFTVGAVARLRRLKLMFLHVDGADEFMAFSEPGWVKLAWSVRVADRPGGCSRLSFELRMGATDQRAWRSARWYFAAIGPGVNWTVRRVLGSIADELGWPTRLGVAHQPRVQAASRTSEVSPAALRLDRAAHRWSS